MILTHKDILLKLEQIERIVYGHDEDISRIFNALKQLIQEKSTPRNKIGYKLDK